VIKKSSQSVLGGSSHFVSGLAHPSYKWINPAYPIYNWGYNPLTKWDEPPSSAQIFFQPILLVVFWLDSQFPD